MDILHENYIGSTDGEKLKPGHIFSRTVTTVLISSFLNTGKHLENEELSYTIYCLLFVVKKFQYFVSLPSFQKIFTVTSFYELS